LTLSQFFSHFFRHENGLPHTGQTFEGRFDLSRRFGIRYSREFPLMAKNMLVLANSS
jgi:hypothetical protein